MTQTTARGRRRARSAHLAVARRPSIDEMANQDALVAAQAIVSEAEREMAQADLLSSLAPPFHLYDGVDLVVGSRADDGMGMTFLLQNPYTTRLSVQIELCPAGTLSGRETIAVELGSLEVLALVVPMVMDPDTECDLIIRSTQPTIPRTRTAAPGHLNRARSAMGIATGMAGLLALGVGHFQWSRAGGDVENPLLLSPTVKGQVRSSAKVRADRLWAPAGESPAVVTVNRRSTGRPEVRWTRLVILAYVWLTAALLTLNLAKITLETPSLEGAAGTLLATALTAVFSLGLIRNRWVVRQRVSWIAPAVGPGIRDRPSLVAGFRSDHDLDESDVS